MQRAPRTAGLEAKHWRANFSTSSVTLDKFLTRFESNLLSPWTIRLLR